jgi:hypothetical protein
MKLSARVAAALIVAVAIIGCSLLVIPFLVHENRARTGLHELDYHIMVRSSSTLENLTLLVPAPSVNGGEDMAPDLLQGSWYGIPSGTRVSRVREHGGLMTMIMVPRFVPEHQGSPVSIPEEGRASSPAERGPATRGDDDRLPMETAVQSIENVPVSIATAGTAEFTRGASLATVVIPVQVGARHMVERTIETRYPFGHEPLLQGSENLVPVECSLPGTVTTRCYTYVSRVSIDHGSPGPVEMDIVVTVSGRNEWWELGWSGNSYTDRVSAHLDGEKTGWIPADGAIRTGDGHY